VAEQRTFGRFQIRGELGRGASGVVLDAFDPVAGRPVALKLLRQGELAQFEAVERLRREGEALARLRHPNVVTVYESGSRDGFHYVALEPIEGEPLVTLLRTLPLGRRLDIVEQVARGLHAAHQAGIVHRDVKPSNILVDREGRARIIDFGLARLAGASVDLTQSGGVLGTPAYMSPEQARSDLEKIGPWSDIYSLGALLHEALTGEMPHSDVANMGQLLERLASDRPSPRPSERVSGVPPQLDCVCARALEKEIGRRYSSAGQFADALRAARFEADASQARNPPVVQVLLVLVLVAALVLAGAAVNLFLRTPRPIPTQGPPPPPPPPPPLPAVRAPEWFLALPEKDRPALPLPPGLVFGAKPGEYVWQKDGSLLLFVPAGTFVMGGEGEDPRESPGHEVELSAFFVGKLEVSVAQFAKFVGATNHETTAEKRGSARALTIGGEMEAPGASWRDPDGTHHPPREDDPVACVSWLDAGAYVEWAGLVLPTEAQWEKAAAWDPRARASRRYAWGDDLPGALSAKVGNVLDEAFLRQWPRGGIAFEGYDDGYVKVAPVGSFPAGASAYGALDMTGNVAEWCRDAFDQTFYARSPAKDPFCEVGMDRIVRGGSFSYGPRLARCRRRGVAPPDLVSENLGFRVAFVPR